MNEITEKRSLEVVTSEIVTIKTQAQRYLLEASIEIGRRLTEAKAMVPYGEWGAYLSEKVEFSQSTATNMMKLYEEYGSGQESLFSSESQALGNLTYTKALSLLALPAEEREVFAAEYDVEAMSTRELERAVRERAEAIDEKARAEKSAAEAAERASNAEAEAAQLKEKVKKLKDAAKTAKESAEREAVAAAEERIKAAEEAARAAEDKLAGAIAEAEAAKARAADAEKQLKAADPDVVTFKASFVRAQKEVDNLFELISKIRADKPDVADKLSEAVAAAVAKWGARI